MTRYIGKVCDSHPDLMGERWAASRQCIGCKRERQQTPEYVEQRRLYRQTEEYRSRSRQRTTTPEYREHRRVYNCRQERRDRTRDYGAAKEAARRARKRNAIIGDVAEISRAWIQLKRKAKRLGMSVDHIIPIAGCRICGAKGLHEPSNFQLLTLTDNSSKGDRCLDCWRLRTG